MLVSDFCWSVLDPDAELGLDEDGLLLSDEDGAPLEPAAEPPPLMPLELGLEDEELDEAPPLEGLFDVSELDGELLDGLDGVVVAPDEEDEPDGEDGLVALEEEPVPLVPALRSHAVSRLAPSAMETAMAIVDSLMWPPWLG